MRASPLGTNSACNQAARQPLVATTHRLSRLLELQKYCAVSIVLLVERSLFAKTEIRKKPKRDGTQALSAT